MEESVMKVIVAAGVLLATAIGMQTEALAQTKAPIYRYCLLEASGGRHGGGGSTLCRFNTIAQCMASRNSFADTCIINPELTFRR
jgi:hypothetical protein